MFISILWYENVDDYYFFGWKMFFHWRFTWVKCFFNHLTKVRWSFDFFLNGKLLSNKGFSKTFIKLLMYIYANVKLCFNFIFIIFVTSFNFEAQIIFMWPLKLFKVSEILHIDTFDTICISKFATNCVNRILPTFATWRWISMLSLMKKVMAKYKTNGYG
jgi:hypothetical protein